MSDNIHSTSHKEILERAIQKAIDGGCTIAKVWLEEINCTTDGWITEPGLSDYYFIFNHDFAKALWDKPFLGTTIPATYEINLEDIPAWKYHLMQMVIADDPIAYLGDNL